MSDQADNISNRAESRDVRSPARDHIILAERDTHSVLDLLEKPPAPTERLIRAVKAGQILR